MSDPARPGPRGEKLLIAPADGEPGTLGSTISWPHHENRLGTAALAEELVSHVGLDVALREGEPDVLAAAQGDLGNIRSAIGTLKAASRNVGSLESLLSDLEGKLRGASAENWSQNASVAQQIVGSTQIELQNLRRSL